MTDFVTRNKEEITSTPKSFYFEKVTTKEWSAILNTIAIIALFSGLKWLSITSGNLILYGILAIGGIFSTPIASNR